VPIKIKKQIRVALRQNSRCPSDALQVALEDLDLRRAELCLQFLFDHSEAAIQPAHTFANEPEVQLGRIIENREDDRYDRHQHCDDSLYIAGHPKGQIPVHVRRAVFVEIASALGDGIFRIGLSGKITDLLKKSRGAMCLQNCVCQKIDNRGMNFLAHQHHVGRRNETDVRRRYFSAQINGTTR